MGVCNPNHLVLAPICGSGAAKNQISRVVGIAAVACHRVHSPFESRLVSRKLVDRTSSTRAGRPESFDRFRMSYAMVVVTLCRASTTSSCT